MQKHYNMPAKRDSADLLAGVLPYATAGGLLGYSALDNQSLLGNY